MLPIFIIVPIFLILLMSLLIIIVRQRRNNRSQKQEIQDYSQKLQRYGTIMDIESETQRLQTNKNELQSEYDNLQNKKLDFQKELTSLKEKISDLKDEIEIQSYGLYQPKYDLGYSTELKNKLDVIRKKQKSMIRDKTAITCSTQWTVNDSKTEGRKMTNKKIQLMARAFNGECDSIILKVRYNNITLIEDRINKTYIAINKLGESQACKVSAIYLELKIQELRVVHQYEEQVKFEKDEKRRIAEQIRDEQCALREIEKAQKQAEEEEKRYQRALEKARQEVEQAIGQKQERLQTEIERLNELLAEAQFNKERAKSRAEMTRSGHVYIISNIGSFGESVYKIGMTRRLIPTDRVRELGDASVPFRFDIHAMIFSEDAPALETHIHKHFEGQSVNRINSRKEFFNVNLEEIERIVKDYNVDAQFIRVPEADEYRKTQAIIAREIPTNTNNNQ